MLDSRAKATTVGASDAAVVTADEHVTFCGRAHLAAGWSRAPSTARTARCRPWRSCCTSGTAGWCCNTHPRRSGRRTDVSVEESANDIYAIIFNSKSTWHLYLALGRVAASGWAVFGSINSIAIHPAVFANLGLRHLECKCATTLA